VAKKLKSDGGISTQKNRGRQDFVIYIRMFSILGFTWIFAILTMAIPENTTEIWLVKLEQLFVILFVVMTGANGIVIFFIFTFNKRIFGLYKKLLWNPLLGEKKSLRKRTWIKRNRTVSSQSKQSNISILTQSTTIYY
jgi:uncharacterized membrane protein YbhN (UPF0104 family)